MYNLTHGYREQQVFQVRGSDRNLDMEELTSVLNKVEEVLVRCGGQRLDLPRVVVVGDQSSGKSSVLEGLVGRSFLPRGTGTVTRRPLLLHLQTPAAGAASIGNHVTFQHIDKVFTDFEEVMQEIQDETDRVAGSNKGICSQPIVMTFFSKDAPPDLTLIDLPGIVKVPMGDQPPDIETTIRGLVMEYVTNPNSIILAVVTANTDIATSESLKIAREVDPKGERTLAVVTKLDLMDAGTSADEILSGNVIAAKLGTIGVVNRCQRDIVQGKSLKEALMEEMDFLCKNYPLVAHKHGTSVLVKRLQSLLIERVKKYLPQLRLKVRSALHYHTRRLGTLNGPETSPPNESLLQILTNFTTTFNAKIQGQANELETRELGGGARISYIFYDVFGTALESINPLEGYSSHAILTAIKNSAGAKPCLFVPEACFEILVKKQIARLEAPSLRCFQLVFDEMEKMIYDCGSDTNIILTRYPKLSQRILQVSTDLLKSRIPETESLVRKLIEIQAAYINTAHPDFKKNPQENQVVPATEESSTIVTLIETFVSTYFGIVKKSVQDIVPKAIMYSFVNYVMDHLLPELVHHLYGTRQQNSELLEESIAITDEKKKTTQMIAALEKANTNIADVLDGNF